MNKVEIVAGLMKSCLNSLCLGMFALSGHSCRVLEYSDLNTIMQYLYFLMGWTRHAFSSRSLLRLDVMVHHTKSKENWGNWLQHIILSDWRYILIRRMSTASVFITFSRTKEMEWIVQEVVQRSNCFFKISLCVLSVSCSRRRGHLHGNYYFV